MFAGANLKPETKHMGTIAVEGMEFHAYHGCFKEEQIIGNNFVVDIYFDTDTSEAEQTDDLDKTINYADVYAVIGEEMKQKSKLLEHVGRRIINSLKEKYPEMESVELKISKMNPPVGGKVGNVSVILSDDEL